MMSSFSFFSSSQDLQEDAANYGTAPANKRKISFRLPRIEEEDGDCETNDPWSKNKPSLIPISHLDEQVGRVCDTPPAGTVSALWSLSSAGISSGNRLRRARTYHYHQRRSGGYISQRNLSVGFISVALILLCIRAIQDELMATRTLFLSWKEDSLFGGQQNKGFINPMLLDDGDVLPVRRPFGAVGPTRREKMLDREILFVHYQGTNNTIRGTEHNSSKSPQGKQETPAKKHPLILLVGTHIRDPVRSFLVPKPKSPLVEPMAEPSSGWEPGDITRSYPTLDSSDEAGDGMEIRLWPNDEFDPKCKPMQTWQSMQFPVCNSVHEFNLEQGIVRLSTSLVSKKGYWRDVWKDKNLIANRTIVWKTFKRNLDMEEAFFENNRVDALAMERLTASKYVIDIYGFCAMTVVQEYAEKEVSDLPKNLDPNKKLNFAVQVAQGIADIHSIDGPNQPPSLVHNDINLANLRLADDGRPVLNDFNVAVLLKKHNETHQTCPFPFRYPNPQWRAPEEQIYSNEFDGRDPPMVTEKVDVYALGNVLYRLLIGQSPWKEFKDQPRLSPERKEEVAHLKRENGTLPDVPQEVKNSTNPAIRLMLKALYQCYRFDPKTRPSAREILLILQNRTTPQANYTGLW